MKPVSMIVNIFLGVVSLMHLIRLIFQIEVTWDGVVVPLWVSFFGFLFTAGLAIMLWRENHKGA